jgi:hypothetical protein
MILGWSQKYVWGFWVFSYTFYYTLILIKMQKSALPKILREELTRALVFGVGFFTILSIGFVWVASAATSGGIFGDILNRILASGNWQTDTTGKVANSEKLGGDTADKFVRVQPSQDCSPKCLSGFNPDGTKICAP